MFPSTFYDKLDPKYREKLLRIEKTFQTAKPFFDNPSPSFLTETKLPNATLNFYSRYMMPKKLWEILLEIDSRYSFRIMNLLKAAQYQFKYKLSASRYHSGKKLYNDISRIKFKDMCDVEDLCYPHIDMDTSLVNYEKKQYSLVPKSVYRTFKRMKLQYDKIKAVEEDEEKWLEAILEVDDKEFVEHNIEFRLGQDLTNKDLWMSYLDYLKSHDKQKLLQAYSKYCRFFLDDTEMLEEYRIAAGNQKVRVPWKNAFDFEVFDEDFYHRQRHERDRSAQKVPLQCHFNAENASNQRFPFRSNLMNYIIKNANACVLHDLFKSCKWFYLKNPVTICYKFQATSFGLIHDQSIAVSNFSSFFPLLEKLFISTNLFIKSFRRSVDLIPRIYRCTAKYVTLCYLKFTDEELRILIGHGNVVELSFDHVRNSNIEYFTLEMVLEMLPKIKLIELNGIQSTSETSQRLGDISFENKIANITFANIQNELLKPKVFAEFINKNVLPKADVKINFNQNVSFDFAQNFFSIAKTAISEYWDEENAPKMDF